MKLTLPLVLAALASAATVSALPTSGHDNGSSDGDLHILPAPARPGGRVFREPSLNLPAKDGEKPENIHILPKPFPGIPGGPGVAAKEELHRRGASMVDGRSMCPSIGGKLSKAEAMELETRAEEFAKLQMTMMSRYKVHFCAAKDIDTCEKCCAYYYDMAPEDGLETAGCMSAGDMAKYKALRQQVDMLKAGYEKKYGEKVPSGIGCGP